MSNLLFGRSWNLIISNNGNKILQYSSDDQIPLRIVFECYPYAELGQPGFIKIQIYNIPQSDMSQISQGNTLQFYVGYVLTGNGLIFNGQIYSFYGITMAELNDINYIFNIFCYSYFTDPNGNSLESSPLILDLPPGAIYNQANVLASYYGYRANPKNILSSTQSQQSPPLKIVADNLDGAILEFYRKTKYSLLLDTRDKTYNLVAAQPQRKQRIEIAKASGPNTITIDNNSGMILYPNFDFQTFFLKVTTLIRSELNYFSKIHVDLSNSIIDGIEKTLTQDIIIQSRLYQYFTIVSLSYRGDTRGIEWYQDIVGVAQS